MRQEVPLQSSSEWVYIGSVKHWFSRVCHDFSWIPRSSRGIQRERATFPRNKSQILMLPKVYNRLFSLPIILWERKISHSLYPLGSIENNEFYNLSERQKIEFQHALKLQNTRNNLQPGI